MDSTDQEAGIYFESYSLKGSVQVALNTSWIFDFSSRPVAIFYEFRIAREGAELPDGK